MRALRRANPCSPRIPCSSLYFTRHQSIPTGYSPFATCKPSRSSIPPRPGHRSGYIRPMSSTSDTSTHQSARNARRYRRATMLATFSVEESDKLSSPLGTRSEAKNRSRQQWDVCGDEYNADHQTVSQSSQQSNFKNSKNLHISIRKSCNNGIKVLYQSFQNFQSF